MKYKKPFFYHYPILFIIIFIIILLFIYAYHSGSCKIKKDYSCSKKFCLYKLFHVSLSTSLQQNVQKLLVNKNIQKRVSIYTYPESILNCALPNKNGITISTSSIKKFAPEIIQFYTHDLCEIISKKIGLNIFSTDLNFPTSCALLIYENENDWINWHYDYNYYNGRFFTVLIPITDQLTCTKFQFMKDSGEIVSLDLTNNGIVFEGNFLYHRASKLCKNQKRVILSCQYVTDNNMSFLNQMRIKLKDFAYTGKLFDN
jgi:hypothetical protein